MYRKALAEPIAWFLRGLRMKNWTVTLLLEDANGDDPQVKFNEREIAAIIWKGLDLPICLRVAEVNVTLRESLTHAPISQGATTIEKIRALAERQGLEMPFAIVKDRPDLIAMNGVGYEAAALLEALNTTADMRSDLLTWQLEPGAEGYTVAE